MDKGHLTTDKLLLTMEKKLTAIYSRANKEVSEKMTKYLKGLEEKGASLQDAIKQAKSAEERAKAEAAYKSFVENKTLKNAHFAALTENFAENLKRVNETAADYVNDRLPSVYALNYNDVGGDISGKVKGYSFEMVDASTVKSLATKDETLLPYKTVNGKKDVRWNTQSVNSEILQGIIQGESIPDISKRLTHVTEMNLSSAIRNARTSTTCAENRGRMDSYHRAQDMGVVIHKVWLATNDQRTREEHAELDGQEREIDEPFENSLGEIMYPGDPDADPANVYNCRCTMITKVIGFEWNQNAEEEPEEEQTPFESEKLQKTLGKNYDDFAERVSGAENRVLYEKYGETANYKQTKNGGVYSKGSDTVTYSMQNRVGMDEYSTLGHECGHMFDNKMGRVAGLNYKEVDLINDKYQSHGLKLKFIPDTPSSSDEFLSAMRKDVEDLKTSLFDGTLQKEFLQSDVMRNSTAGIQDLLDGFFGTRDRFDSAYLPWGHGNKYYNWEYNNRVAGFGLQKELKSAFVELGFDASNQDKVKRLCRQYDAASELWANVSGAVTCGGDELKAIQNYLPNTLKTYGQIVEKAGGK